MRVRSVLKGAAATYRFSLNQNDEIDALKDSIFAMERKISEYQVRREALKCTIHAVFVKANDPNMETNPTVVVSAYEQLICDIELFQRNGSGKILAHVNSLDLTL